MATHLSSRIDQKTVCGRDSARVPWTDVVDEVTCGRCLVIDEARACREYARDMAGATLAAALLRVPEARQHVESTVAVKQRWEAFALRMWTRDQDAATDAVVDNLRRMLARVNEPASELARRWRA